MLPGTILAPASQQRSELQTQQQVGDFGMSETDTDPLSIYLSAALIPKMLNAPPIIDGIFRCNVLLTVGAASGFDTSYTGPGTMMATTIPIRAISTPISRVMPIQNPGCWNTALNPKLMAPPKSSFPVPLAVPPGSGIPEYCCC